MGGTVTEEKEESRLPEALDPRAHLPTAAREPAAGSRTEPAAVHAASVCKLHMYGDYATSALRLASIPSRSEEKESANFFTPSSSSVCTTSS